MQQTLVSMKTITQTLDMKKPFMLGQKSIIVFVCFVFKKRTKMFTRVFLSLFLF